MAVAAFVFLVQCVRSPGRLVSAHGTHGESSVDSDLGESSVDSVRFCSDAWSCSVLLLCVLRVFVLVFPSFELRGVHGGSRRLRRYQLPQAFDHGALSRNPARLGREPCTETLPRMSVICRSREGQRRSRLGLETWFCFLFGLKRG